MMEALEQRALFDALSAQIVGASLSLATPAPGASVAIRLDYTTAPVDKTVTGLGLRVHYDSTRLDWTGMSKLLKTGLLAKDEIPQDDANDWDGDSTTDKYFQVAWADFGGKWPDKKLPTALLDAWFRLSIEMNPGDTTAVRFTASDTTAGYGFQADPLTITAGEFSETRELTSDQKVTYTDYDGDLVTVKLKGPGTAEATVPINGSRMPASFEITETTGATSVTVTVKKNRATGGDGKVKLGDVAIANDFGSFTAKTGILQQSFVAESIKSLTLGGAIFSEINLGEPANESDAVTLNLGVVSDISITSQTPVRALNVVQWDDATDFPDVITAPWLGSLNCTGKRSAGLNGDFHAAIQLDGTGVASGKPTLGSVKIAGDASTTFDDEQIQWRISGDVGSVAIGGDMVGVELRATRIKSLKAVNMDRCDVFADIAPTCAGVREDSNDAPTVDDLGGSGEIGAFTVSGRLSNSFVAAASLGHVRMAGVDDAAESKPYGLTCHRFASYLRSLPLPAKKLKGPGSPPQTLDEVGDYSFKLL